ncbi:MAG: beta-L-arabinofuranosidase domain-containing protein, partial [Sedimentisphaerales bacterium]
DNFWTPRLETSHNVTIPYAFTMCEETGRIRNFEKAAGLRQGKHEGIHFDDSDVYKIMEGASYSLQVNPEKMMRLYLDKLVTIMKAAQWEDGYLFTFYSLPERQPEKRWMNIPWIHEQYCVGHMYEAAVAHYQVTGEDTFLDIARKNADLICETFAPYKRTDPPGHQEIEIGLCKLYRATGDEKYLNQAKFFLDQRGRKGNRGPKGDGGLYGTYSQDHKPVTEQNTAVGHSVRAAYLYTAMADVAALTGNMEYIKAIDAIKDQILPENSSDSSAMQLDFWPHKGTTEWLQFDWDQEHKISSVKVYWFDDTGRGECHLPKTWRLLFRDTNGNFKPVNNKSSYDTDKDTFNKVDFEPVKTNSIKIEIILQEAWSAGIQEVVIE